MDLIHLQEQPSKVGPETALECVRRAIWGILYADDVYIVLRSPRRLGRMMTVFVEVFGTFGLTISDSKTETMCTGNDDSPQRYGARVPPDNHLRLFGMHSDCNPKPVRRDRPADSRGLDGLQTLHAGAVRQPEGKPAAP